MHPRCLAASPVVVLALAMMLGLVAATVASVQATPIQTSRESDTRAARGPAVGATLTASSSGDRRAAVTDTLCRLIDRAYMKAIRTSFVSQPVRKSSGAMSEGPHKGDAMLAGAGDATCTYVRDEAINGEAAAVYQQDVDAQHGWGGARRITLVWISTSSGLPIRQEQDADFGNDGKGHESLYFNWVKH